MLTSKMLGSRSDHARTPFKGAEAKVLVGFCLEQLLRHRVEGAAAEDLFIVGMHLRRFIRLVDVSPLEPAPEVLEEMRRSCALFLIHGMRGGMRSLAKTHQMFHMSGQMRLHGNVKYGSIFLDEHLNKNMQGVASRAYSSVWHSRIFISWKELKYQMPRGWRLGME